MVYTTTKMVTMTAACKTSMKSSFNVVLLLTLALLFIRTPSAQAVDALSNEDAKIIEDTVFKGNVDSEAVEYFASLGRIAIAGFVLAILCLVGSILFFLVRCFICMSSEGQNFCPSPVNPNDKMTTEEEEQQRRFLLKAGVCVVSAGVIAGCALSIVGTVKLTSALRDLKDKTLRVQAVESLETLISEVKDVFITFDSMVTKMLSSTGEEESSGLMGGVSGILDEVTEMVDKAVDYVNGDINDIADMALSAVKGAGIGVGALVAVVVLAGLLGTINGVRGALGSAMCAAPFWLVSAFFMFALFSMGHLLLDILCSELDVVKYCSGLENPDNDSTCSIESYTWDSLNGLLEEELGLDVASQDFGSDIQEYVAEYVNVKFLDEKVYSPLCNTLKKYQQLPINVPEGYCFAEDGGGGGPYLCDGTNVDPGCVSLSNFEEEFRERRCDGVPDMKVALEKVVETFDSDAPVVLCIKEGQVIGNTTYTEIFDLVSKSSSLLGNFETSLNPFELKPVDDILDLLVNTDCPATLDALYFLYVGFCLIGVFLVFSSIGWLLGMYWLQPPATVVPEGYNSAYEVDDNYYGDEHKYPGAIAQSQAFVPIANPA